MSIVIEDGHIRQTIPDNVLWNGKFSVAYANGPIIQFIQSMLPANTVCVIPKSDGNINRPIKGQYQNVDWEKQIQPHLDYAIQAGKKFIIGTLAQITEEPYPVHYLYIPLDDTFFNHGIFPVVADPWKQRSSQLCWRGGCSGGGNQSARVRFVDYIYKMDPSTDVRLSKWWSEGKQIPSHLFRERIPHQTFFRHKIIFIVDGNVIASNQMYAFASGSVPFLITNAKCWFSHLIRPFVHYIPIKYDLSDLEDHIRFVEEHKEEAEAIATNAVELSRTIFSPEYQREYIRSRIQEI